MTNPPSVIPMRGGAEDMGKGAGWQNVLPWKKKVGSNKGICSKAPIGWEDRVVKIPFFCRGQGATV